MLRPENIKKQVWRRTSRVEVDFM